MADRTTDISGEDVAGKKNRFGKLLGIDTAHNFTMSGFRSFDGDFLAVFPIRCIHGRAPCNDSQIHPLFRKCQFRFAVAVFSQDKGFFFPDGEIKETSVKSSVLINQSTG
ncbi:cold shock protein CspA [Dialister micraerophilus DSM 19965]|uniref:Cold shock protein CspA n=1 Tax=Dialister micraerophilus DSM 19965 TaxID=888062 RepID=F2BWS6_9FIRM|nr:cold shock protein CspA [Dialister micraerophilus DSM 19965]